MDREKTLTLLERAREGDRLALDELCARWLPPLRRWAAGRLPRWARDATDTHDLVQDALMRTLSRIDHLEHRAEGAIEAYLRQVVLNRIRDEVRRVGRRFPHQPLPEDRAAVEASPLEEAIGTQALQRYEAALARLSAADREAIVARVELDYSYEEMAAALGRPSAEAARMAVRRALLRLAREMQREARRS